MKIGINKAGSEKTSAYYQLSGIKKSVLLSRPNLASNISVACLSPFHGGFTKFRNVKWRQQRALVDSPISCPDAAGTFVFTLRSAYNNSPRLKDNIISSHQ